MKRTPRVSIDAFLGLKRIAFAGVSREGSHFSRMLMREFQTRGYEVIPVNPYADQVEGMVCYPKVSAIHPAPEGVLVLTAAGLSAEVVEDAARAGVKHVWLYRAVGSGSVSGEALGLAGENGMDVVAGECPFMFFDKPGFPHNLHRAIRSITGTLPA
jgi:predicted CoA-binding protein